MLTCRVFVRVVLVTARITAHDYRDSGALEHGQHCGREAQVERLAVYINEKTEVDLGVCTASNELGDGLGQLEKSIHRIPHDRSVRNTFGEVEGEPGCSVDHAPTVCLS